jgi:hypothetical protein
MPAVRCLLQFAAENEDDDMINILIQEEPIPRGVILGQE